MALKNYDLNYPQPFFPSGHFPIELDESADISYIYQSILYANQILLKTSGDFCSIYRKKQTGTRCTNPNCPAHNDYEANGSSDCLICLGTGFVGGYDYIEEVYIRFTPAVEKIQLTEQGVLRDVSPHIWTMPNPRLFQFDIIINYNEPKIMQMQMLVDVPITRSSSGNFDLLQSDTCNQVVRIFKISNNANSSTDYQPDIDFTVSNNGILWQSTNMPTAGNQLYVTYQYSAWHYRRYEINNVEPSRMRGLTLHQNLQITELNATHSAYRIQAQAVDPAPITYPFPISEWFSR